jgi:hypothetical protein
MKVYKQMKMYNDDELNPILYQNKSNMAAFFFCIRTFFQDHLSLAFIGTLYVFYEIIFVTEEQHSGIAIYLVALLVYFSENCLEKKCD